MGSVRYCSRFRLKGHVFWVRGTGTLVQNSPTKDISISRAVPAETVINHSLLILLIPSYLVEPQQVVTLYLGNDKVQVGALRHLLHHTALGIAPYLLLGLVPLLLGFGLRGGHG